MKSLLYLSAIFCASLLPIRAADSAPQDAKPVTVMPLGDSITEGGDGFYVYRYPLLKKLRDAGYNVTYVGSKTTHAVSGSSLGVLCHEGYAGQNSAFLSARFEALYRKNPADIVLLHAGHNQSADQKPIPGLLKDTRSIIATARAINPKVIILLGQVIPSGKLPKYSYIPAFNQALVSPATELNTAVQPVILVNQAAGFTWQSDTIDDHVHPNQQGAEKMASRWFEALQKVLPSPSKNTAPAAPTVSRPPAPHTPTQSLRLWTGAAPGAPTNPGPEVIERAGRISHISVPMLDVYLPSPERANGTAIIICSGGGYTRLASGPLGQGAADVFCPLGYAVFSLKYRVSPPSENVLRDAITDARQAMRLVRSHAAEWHIAPDRIGMVGFSAGANLILNLVTTPDGSAPSGADPLARYSTRPDFVGLIATWPYNQKIANFAISSRVPRAFILHAQDDTTAPIRFAEEIAAAWRRAAVPVQFIPYETGGHMAFNFPQPSASDWTTKFIAWLGP